MYGRKLQRVAFTCLLSEIYEYIHWTVLCSEQMLPLETMLTIFWFISLRCILTLSSYCHLVLPRNCSYKNDASSWTIILRDKVCGTWSHFEWGWKVVCISIMSVRKVNTVLFSLSLFLRKYRPISYSTVWVTNNYHCAACCCLKGTKN